MLPAGPPGFTRDRTCLAPHGRADVWSAGEQPLPVRDDLCDELPDLIDAGAGALVEAKARPKLSVSRRPCRSSSVRMARAWTEERTP